MANNNNINITIMKNNHNKSVTITAPEGYEIDTVTSNEILFRKIKLFNPYPTNVRDIPFRRHYISSITGQVGCDNSIPNNNDKNYLSTNSRARAFLALMQLVELRDAWQKVDNKFINYEDITNFNILSTNTGTIFKGTNTHLSRVLTFSLSATRDKFAETFKDLIEEAKELI